MPKVQFHKINKSLNGKADALAKLAKELAEPNLSEIQVTIRNRRILTPVFPEEEFSQSPLIKKAMVTEALLIEEDDDWRSHFINYFRHGKVPEDKSARRQLKIRVMRFAFVNDTLYRRSFGQMWLRCLGAKEIKDVMHEVHSGL